ncbi:hypothetical protein RIF29_16499 [Crotalaria pallida]|uniref:Uncharacterized protein n=1 Tax=Crotalaria pallida TaxID=3830 RepID=A0AAN9FMK2_CROPI
MEGGCEAEKSNIPRLNLFKFKPPLIHSPERSGMQTPPLHTSVSVPFWWEQEPGKPKPCTALVSFSNKKPTPKCLELPPRLLINDANPSPTSVLESPYDDGDDDDVDDWHGGSFAFGGERGAQLGTMVVTKGVGRRIKEKGWFDSWREKVFKVSKEVSGGSHVFPSSADRVADHIGGSHNKKLRITKVKRSRSSSNIFHATSCVWTISEGLKQVVPWRSKKQKKNGCGGLRI